MTRSVSTSAIVLLCSVVFCIPAVAQFETRVNTVFPTTGYPALAVADFNGDGNLDVAAVSTGLQIFLGKGDGTFQRPTNYEVGKSPNSIALGDFNGDGKIDIALTNYLSNSVSVLFGNGDGTFRPAATLSTSTNPGFISTGDFNGDHKLDLVLLDYPYVTVFLNKGDGSFGVPINTSPAPGEQLRAISAPADFDGNGTLDLAIAINTAYVGYITILSGNGDGTFALGATYAGFPDPSNIAVGDLRGNGYLDMVVTEYDLDSIDVFLGNGDGTFQPSTAYPSGSAVWAAIGDTNGDGKQDIIVSNLLGPKGGPGGVNVLLGNGDGTFQPYESFAAGILPAYVALGDFNRDGMLDVLSADRSGDIFTLLNTGTVNFLPTSPVAFSSQLIGTTSTPAAAQLTNAGDTPIRISSVTLHGAPFKITNNACTGTLAPGAGCKIGVTFTPTAKNSVTGTLSIVDTASSKPQVVELSGAGTVVKLVPSALNFPPTKVGTTSAPQTIQLTNTGGSPLNFTYFIYSGGGYGNDYPESDNCGDQLSAGASCTITVSFTPHNTGARNSYLVIQDDGGGSPQQPKLTGSGG